MQTVPSSVLAVSHYKILSGGRSGEILTSEGTLESLECQSEQIRLTTMRKLRTERVLGMQKAAW